MFEEPLSEVHRILNVLGNETRRRILRLLAQEPHYFIQISRDLGVSQQAILKHLDLLEKTGFVSSYRAKSNFAAPERKYYRLNRSLYLSIGITEDDVMIRLRDIAPDQDEEERNLGDALLLEDGNPSAENDRGLDSLLRRSRDLLRKIDGKIAELERSKLSLLRMRQTVMKRVHDVVRSNFENDLERDILYSLVASGAPLDVGFLSERLNVREREIERCLEALRDRLALPFE